MKLLKFAIFLLLVSFHLAAIPIKIISYNIRYDNPGDGINQWVNRREKVYALILKNKPDILCIQEGLHNQVEDLQNTLPLYFHVGVGRDDGKERGEYSAIFFLKSKFELVHDGNFWLSETPETPGSKGWDAAIIRICSYAKVRLLSADKELFVFNTHFDHIGDTAREESAKLILKKMNELTNGLPVLLAGDLNSEPYSMAYQTIIRSKKPVLTDTYFSKPNIRNCTFTGFLVGDSICKRIDYIFTSNHFKRKEFKILTEHDGIYYPSDHLPVYAEIELKE